MQSPVVKNTSAIKSELKIHINHQAIKSVTDGSDLKNLDSM